jgi:hypothetical protein
MIALGILAGAASDLVAGSPAAAGQHYRGSRQGRGGAPAAGIHRERHKTLFSVTG